MDRILGTDLEAGVNFTLRNWVSGNNLAMVPALLKVKPNSTLGPQSLCHESCDVSDLIAHPSPFRSFNSSQKVLFARG